MIRYYEHRRREEIQAILFGAFLVVLLVGCLAVSVASAKPLILGTELNSNGTVWRRTSSIPSALAADRRNNPSATARTRARNSAPTNSHQQNLVLLPCVCVSTQKRRLIATAPITKFAGNNQGCFSLEPCFSNSSCCA